MPPWGVWSLRRPRTEGTILVQDKGRGSQASPGQTTPPRNAGRDKGLRDLRGEDRRWSVWLTSGVTGWSEWEHCAFKPA